jgi:alpha-amylase/alpha-mannosidase (GH57 family)
MSRYVCIHGHFYQPPRENAWLETVELQDSAVPYHDWNERITAECYGPNARARVMDGNGKIVDLANNYARMSFNFGPTLLNWMQRAFPEIHELIVQADHASMEFFSGHGSALAQVYNHMILPLANLRDKRTQVLWGIRDFESRFSRPPEGMWLPETAADTESLEVLAENGIRFTILSPFQARQVRLLGSEQWTDVDGGKIDSRRPYLCKLPSGRSIALFFYDGGLSRAVAFEKLQTNGELLARRLREAFSPDGGEDELVHIATDGESYGHHLAYGDMALAWALKELDQSDDVHLTNYGEYLENHPPKYEAAIHEKSAWSCSHGVGRWNRDCGCNSGGHPGWNQAWRGPLRQAFDWLRDVTMPLYENQANRYFNDAWGARDQYISVILDRSAETMDAFFSQCADRPLAAKERSEILKMLELQRHAMLMYTSCGWFFDELSGIETVQVIQYAGRVVELCQEIFGLDLEPQFLERLADAKSNIPEHSDGRAIYMKWVKPAMITLKQATAHYAIESLFQNNFDEERRVFVFTFEKGEREIVTAGKARLVIGHTRATSDITEETAQTTYAVFYMGEHNLTAGVREFSSPGYYETMASELKSTFDEVDFPKVIRAIGQHFGEPIYSLKSLFKDAQRQVLHELLKTTRTDLENRFRRIAERYVPLMKFLGPAAKSLLPAVETASTFVMRMDLVLQFGAELPDIDKLTALVQEARQKGDLFMDADLSFTVASCMERLIHDVCADPSNLDKLRVLRQIAELTLPLPLHLNLWKVQNVYWEMLHSTDIDFVKKVEEGATGAFESHREFIRLGICLGFAVDGIEIERIERE